MRCTPTEAARQLTRLAEQAGVEPAELAADLVDQAAAAHSASSQITPAPVAPLRRPETEALLTIAASGTELADAVLEEVSRGTNAAGAIVWRLTADGALELLGQSGLTSGEAIRWRHIPAPMVNTLCQQAVHRREPIWLHSASEAGDGVVLTGGWRGGRAVLPLLGPATMLGILEICWPTPVPDFGPSLRNHLNTLADLCARTLDLRRTDLAADPATGPETLLDGILDSGLFVHAVYDRDAVTGFLISHITERFSDPAGRPASLFVDRQLATVYPGLVTHPLHDQLLAVLRTGVPYQRDRLPVSAIVPGTASTKALSLRIARFVDGLLITWRPYDTADDLAAALATVERLGRIGGWEFHPADHSTTWTDHTYELFDLPVGSTPPTPEALRDQAHPDDAPYLAAFIDLLLQQRQAASTNFRFVRDDGTLRQFRASAEPVLDATGELAYVRGTFQDISTHYQTQMALSATQDQLADTEDQVREQARIALQLQRAILPPADRPLRLPGLEAVMRYRPPQEEHNVGGDWYDAVALPGDQVLFAVGDVSGHGIAAANTMVALRNGLRGLAVTGASPGQLLSSLNSMVVQLYAGTTATVVCGLYDLPSRQLQWAKAGHLPPMLVRDGVAALLPQPRGILLGAREGISYEEATFTAAAGDTLLLYTDGLVERRGTVLDECLAELTRTASRPIPNVERFVEDLLDNSIGDGTDDTCLLAIQTL
jgi:serine phosphatase RsbU (regulator of sigma subunit)